MGLPLGRWRLTLLLAALVAAASAFTACGDDNDGVVGGGGEPAPPDQQKLTLHSIEPNFFDPHRSNSEQDIAVERMLFRGLYQLQSKEGGGVEVEPAYAQGDPQVSSDGLKFTVKIKPGMNWSDGQALTAKHFADGIKRGCSPDAASPYAYLLQTAEEHGILGVKGCNEYLAAKTDQEKQAAFAGMGVTATDDQTLEINLVEPKLPLTFKQIMSMWVTFPTRMDVIQRFGERWTDPGNIVVNGPFTLTQYTPKDRVVLKPNPNWGLDPKPKLQEMTIRFIDDLSQAYRAFQTGELDQARIPEATVQQARQDQSLKDSVIVVGSSRIAALNIQMEHPILSNFKVREALSKAIDRDTMVQVLYKNVNLPAEYWLVEGMAGHQGRDKFKDHIGFNEAAAKKALADAGFPNGQGFPRLKLTTGSSPSSVSQAEFLKAQFKRILNIDIDIETLDGRTLFQRFNAGQFELFAGGFQLDYPDPENPIVGLFNTGGGNNKYNCSDQEIDRKITEGSAAKDESRHIKLFQEAETLIVTRLCGVIPIWQGAIPYLVSDKVGGVRPNGTIDAAQPGNWCPECWYVKA